MILVVLADGGAQDGSAAADAENEHTRKDQEGEQDGMPARPTLALLAAVPVLRALSWWWSGPALLLSRPALLLLPALRLSLPAAAAIPGYCS